MVDQCTTFEASSAAGAGLPGSTKLVGVPVVGVMVAAVLLLGACSSGAADGTAERPAGTAEGQEGTDVAEGVTDELINAASASLDAPEGRLQFDEPLLLAPSACRIHPVWDIESTTPVPLRFAVLGDGTVIPGSTAGNGAAVLDACFPQPGPEPSAEVMAQVVVSMERTPGPLELLDRDLERKLEPLGRRYEPPTLTVGDSGTTVTFFAIDRELDVIHAATATRLVDGSLTIDYVELT